MASFSDALMALKAGKHIRRAEWAQSRVHVYMEEQRVLMEGSRMERTQGAYMVLYISKGHHYPGWNPSTHELLSDDWEILSPHETDYSDE